MVLDCSRHFFLKKGVERPEQHHVSRHFFLEKNVDANGEPYKVSVGFDTFFQKKSVGSDPGPPPDSLRGHPRIIKADLAQP